MVLQVYIGWKEKKEKKRPRKISRIYLPEIEGVPCSNKREI